MGVAILTICAYLGGVATVFFIYETRNALFRRQQSKLNDQIQEHNDRLLKLNQSIADHQEAIREFKEQRLKFEKEQQQFKKQLNIEKQLHLENVKELSSRNESFNNQKVSYDELRNENAILKTDLRNNSVIFAKQDFELKEIGRKQKLIHDKSDVLGRRFLKDTLRWIDDSLNQHNYAANKQRLTEAITWCREIGVEIGKSEEMQLHAELKMEYEKVVRAAYEKEEQARIKAQIREEQQHEKEVQRAIDDAERERRAVEAALARLKAEADGRHTEEIQKLEAQLAEAIAKSQRAVSQAQLTRAGYVYVISNIGSLGSGIFKIGMTRRLEPKERVDELSSASVPFPYDIHMMISTNDAPKLENALHHAFQKTRVNKTNPRKEFFKVKLEEIIKVVHEEHGEVLYTIDPEALQYRQSLNMTLEDQDFIEQVYEKIEDTNPSFGNNED